MKSTTACTSASFNELAGIAPKPVTCFAEGSLID